MSIFYQEGPYVGEIISQALGKAKTGTPQFILQFKVLDGGPVYTRTIFMAITEKTVEFVVAALEKLGYGAGTFGALDPSHPNHESFVGRQIDVYCRHENDQNGNLREKWSISRGASAFKVDPLDNRELRKLDALFGKQLPKPAPVSSPPRPLADGTVITDDDIPF